MLCSLFSSLRSMKRPEAEYISFLIVENNVHKTLDQIVDGFRAAMPGSDIEYCNEAVLGISAVRNFALDHAITRNHDLLIYVDDDETVEPDWLINLLKERDDKDLDIVGSPVRPTPFQPNLTLMQRIVWSGIARNSQKSERRCREKCAAGRANTIKIATGSWMGKLSFFRETGLRFDQRLGLTGGEDWNLWLSAKQCGAKTGWAPGAIVYETVPAPRLTLSYHFRRTRDHNITEFSARYRENRQKALRKLPLKILSRGVNFLGAACSIPLLGGKGLLSAACALGGLTGIIQGSLGVRTMHYSDTTGF
jgi:glycosyltransferase involved in cell wall biosynthesis